jgi:hypothetical protein
MEYIDMTKKFLELNFPQDPADIEDSTPQEIIRLVVVDDEEAQSLYDQLDKRITDRPHTPHLHECNHSAAGNAPCIMHDLQRPTT